MTKEEVATYVTREYFSYYWQQANKRISSSYSGLHFGHYKAASFDQDLSAIDTLKSSLCAQMGTPLARLGRGLTILLEKVMGNNFIHKMQAIYLLEADFNWWNKLIFARQMVEPTVGKNTIPDDVFAKNRSQYLDASLSKT